MNVLKVKFNSYGFEQSTYMFLLSENDVYGSTDMFYQNRWNITYQNPTLHLFTQQKGTMGTFRTSSHIILGLSLPSFDPLSRSFDQLISRNCKKTVTYNRTMMNHDLLQEIFAWVLGEDWEKETYRIARRHLRDHEVVYWETNWNHSAVIFTSSWWMFIPHLADGKITGPLTCPHVSSPNMAGSWPPWYSSPIVVCRYL